MNSLKLLIVLGFFPFFCYAVTDNNATDGECPCSITCDLTTGYCTDPVGSCQCDWDCYEIGPGDWYCDTDCYCNDAAPSAQTSRQSSVLVYANLNTAQQNSLMFGSLGTNEGTAADKKRLIIIPNHHNPKSNEVQIKPAWCK